MWAYEWICLGRLHHHHHHHHHLLLSRNTFLQTLFWSMTLTDHVGGIEYPPTHAHAHAHTRESFELLMTKTQSTGRYASRGWSSIDDVFLHCWLFSALLQAHHHVRNWQCKEARRGEDDSGRLCPLPICRDGSEPGHQNRVFGLPVLPNFHPEGPVSQH